MLLTPLASSFEGGAEIVPAKVTYPSVDSHAEGGGVVGTVGISGAGVSEGTSPTTGIVGPTGGVIGAKAISDVGSDVRVYDGLHPIVTIANRPSKRRRRNFWQE
jgi:hypothetical protein